MDYTSPETYANDISRQTALAAHNGTSFVPEKRADSALASYAADLATTYTNLAERCASDEQRAALLEMWPRYRETYKQLATRYLQSRSGLMSTMITGASGFPAARMNKQNDRVTNRLNEWINITAKILRRMERRIWPSKTGIRSGDSDAVQQLEAKIATLTARRDWMKTVNKNIRANAKKNAEDRVTALVALLESKHANPRAYAIELLRPDAIGRIGFADFELTNIGATIRTAEKRLETLRKAKTTEPLRIDGNNGITLEHNPAEHRVRLFFPGKPDATTRENLKRNGFRWTPSLGAWQAYPNSHSIEYAKRLTA